MKKGISFTLTIIIVAVVLMAGALTLVTMFGAGVGDFFGALTETSTEARVNRECNSAIRDINSRVCDRVPDLDSINEVLATEQQGLQEGETVFIDEDEEDEEDEENGNGEVTLDDIRDSPNTHIEDEEDLRRQMLGDKPDCNQLGCDWSQIIGEEVAEVNVDGEVYDCQNQGYIQGDTCPVGGVDP